MFIPVQPSGVADVLILDHPLTRHTFAVHPGQDLFTSSSDGGKTWAWVAGGRRQDLPQVRQPVHRAEDTFGISVLPGWHRPGA